MARTVKEGKFTYWINGDGMKIPVSMVEETEKLQDEIITKHVKKAKEIRKLIEEFKKNVRSDVSVLLDLMAEQLGENWQGNGTIYDYSKEYAVKIKNHKRKEFAVRVNMAVSKIDRWLSEVASDESIDIVGIVRKLTKVDDKGKYDKDSLKQLLDIRVTKNQQLWNEAMEIIRTGEEIVGTKIYYSFLERSDENKFDPIILDFANC
jgi:Protein of unknown function (DUF3164)